MERILCLPLGVIVGIKTDSACICFVCMSDVCIYFGGYCWDQDRQHMHMLCMHMHVWCMYILSKTRVPKAPGKCHVSLQPPVSVRVSSLPCSPPTKFSANRLGASLSFPGELLPLPHLHLERLLGLTMKENKTRTVSRAGILSIIQSTFFFSEMAENLGHKTIPAQLSHNRRKLCSFVVYP